jgi:Bromodomain
VSCRPLTSWAYSHAPSRRQWRRTTSTSSDTPWTFRPWRTSHPGNILSSLCKDSRSSTIASHTRTFLSLASPMLPFHISPSLSLFTSLSFPSRLYIYHNSLYLHRFSINSVILRGHYKSMQSVRQDFELMCLNALVFNKVSTQGLSNAAFVV